MAAASAAIARKVGRIQTGFIYHYAFAMFIGLAVMLAWLVLGVARG